MHELDLGGADGGEAFLEEVGLGELLGVIGVRKSGGNVVVGVVERWGVGFNIAVEGVGEVVGGGEGGAGDRGEGDGAVGCYRHCDVMNVDLAFVVVDGSDYAVERGSKRHLKSLRRLVHFGRW